MAICERCGCEFDKNSAQQTIDERYGTGSYSKHNNQGDICADCVKKQIVADNRNSIHMPSYFFLANGNGKLEY